MADKFLSVVIPAYNESKNIDKGVLKPVSEYLGKQDYSWEILLVDDCSTDNTLDSFYKYEQKNKNVRVLAEPHRGKGGTVIAGMLKAKGEIVLFTDLDQATPLPEIEKFIPEFQEGYDVVIGSRSGRKGAPLIRKLMAWGFSLLRTIILRLPYKDTQCGFKLFKKDAAKKIFTKQTIAGFGFDVELLYLARKYGHSIKELPVSWKNDPSSKVNVIRDSFRMLSDLIKIRINNLRNKY